MSQIQKSRSQIYADLADNTSQNISPQDSRNAFESSLGCSGSYETISASATAIASAGVEVKAAGTTAIMVTLDGFSHSDNRLTLTAATAMRVTIDASVSMRCAAGNQVCGVGFAVNGTPVGTFLTRKISVANDVGNMSARRKIDMSPGDYVEVWVVNNDSDADITVDDMHVVADGVVI